MSKTIILKKRIKLYDDNPTGVGIHRLDNGDVIVLCGWAIDVYNAEPMKGETDDRIQSDG